MQNIPLKKTNEQKIISRFLTPKNINVVFTNFEKTKDVIKEKKPLQQWDVSNGDGYDVTIKYPSQYQLKLEFSRDYHKISGIFEFYQPSGKDEKGLVKEQYWTFESIMCSIRALYYLFLAYLFIIDKPLLNSVWCGDPEDSFSDIVWCFKIVPSFKNQISEAFYVGTLNLVSINQNCISFEFSDYS